MSDFTNAAKKVVGIVKNSKNSGPKSYDPRAEVKRVDKKSRKAFVKFGDEIDETPVDLTIDCNVGDIVQVRVGGGKAWLTGNLSAPPTDSRPAIQYTNKTKEEVEGYAKEKADKAEKNAKKYAYDKFIEASEFNQYMDFVEGPDGGLKLYAESKEGTTLDTYTMMRNNGLHIFQDDDEITYFTSSGAYISGGVGEPYTTITSGGFTFFDPSQIEGNYEVYNMYYDSSDDGVYCKRSYYDMTWGSTEEYIKYDSAHLKLYTKYAANLQTPLEAGIDIAARATYLPIGYVAGVNIYPALNVIGDYKRNGNDFLKVVTVSKDNISVPTSGTASDDISLDSSDSSNYKIIGVVGHDIDNATSSGLNASRVYITALRRKNDTSVTYQLGTSASNTKIKLTAYCLVMGK